MRTLTCAATVPSDWCGLMHHCSTRCVWNRGVAEITMILRSKPSAPVTAISNSSWRLSLCGTRLLLLQEGGWLCGLRRFCGALGVGQCHRCSTGAQLFRLDSLIQTPVNPSGFCPNRAAVLTDFTISISLSACRARISCAC